ncbi:hypothetical protein BD770DRAFT_383472 [Pilaira anomala]|nr:hypothetical protein BD770DRAFT_383472 [Pilaira anomala]
MSEISYYLYMLYLKSMYPIKSTCFMFSFLLFIKSKHVLIQAIARYKNIDGNVLRILQLVFGGICSLLSPIQLLLCINRILIADDLIQNTTLSNGFW